MQFVEQLFVRRIFVQVDQVRAEHRHLLTGHFVDVWLDVASQFTAELGSLRFESLRLANLSVVCILRGNSDSLRFVVPAAASLAATAGDPARSRLWAAGTDGRST